MLKKFTCSAVIACLVLLASAAATPAPQEKKEKRPKDQAEYELINKAFKEQDPAKKLPLLIEWQKKYAESDYKIDRVRLIMNSYQGTNQPAKAIETAKDLLKLVPGDFTANYTITSLTPPLAKTDAATLGDGQTAAKALLGGGIAKQFTSAAKPPNVSQAQWNAARRQAEVAAHQTLGWIAMQKKDNVGAEKEFVTLLKTAPNSAQVSYWLGNVVLSQGDPNKNELALFSFARASTYDGPGALAPQGRQQVSEYLAKVYTAYTGTEDGLAELKAMAKNQVLPPADLKIEPAAVRKYKAEQKSRKQNPLLWVYRDLKTALTGADGDKTWAELKGKLTPKMRLYVVSSNPPARPRTINLSSKKGGAIEVVLSLENRRRTGVGAGTMLTIDGVAITLAKAPFKLGLNDGHTF